MRRTPLRRKTPLKASKGKRKPKTQRKILYEQCDKLFSRVVRARGKCEAEATKTCSGSNPSKLQCAHILGRSYNSIRWDEQNALCLCAGCHYYFTHHPAEWQLFIDRKLGQGSYMALLHRAVDHSMGSRTISEMALLGMRDHLRMRLDELGRPQDAVL